MKSNIYLLIGGLFSLTFAIFQVGGVFLSPDFIAYLGGPVKLQTDNPALFDLLCIIIGIIVAISGLYALSGAGKLRRLPLLRSMLLVITSIYLLRGLHIVIDIISMFKYPELNLLHFVVFSLIAFCIGIIHLIGVIKLIKYNQPERIKT